MNEKYSNDEAEEILRLAVQQHTSSEISRDQLLQSAQELGISVDQVEQAEKLVAAKKSEYSRFQGQRHLQEQFGKSRRGSIMATISGWLGTSVTVLGINYLTGFHSFWSKWVIIPYGLTVLGQVIHQALVPPENDYEGFREWLDQREDVLSDWNAFEEKAPERGQTIRALLAQGNLTGAHKALEVELGMEDQQRRILIQRLTSPEN